MKLINAVMKKGCNLKQMNFAKRQEGKFLTINIEFGRSFGMSSEGDCHEVEVTPNLELFVTFGMSLEGVCHELFM
jgi:hypothetical protein